MQRRAVKPPPHAKGDKFTIAVPRHRVGNHPEPLQNPRHPQTQRPQRRLSNVRPRQGRCMKPTFVFIKAWLRIDLLIQAWSYIINCPFRLGERFGKFRKGAAQLQPHVHRLAALTGKQKSKPTVRSTGPVKNPLRRQSRFYVPRIQRSPGLRHQRRPIRFSIQNHHQPMRVAGRKRSPRLTCSIGHRSLVDSIAREKCLPFV